MSDLDDEAVVETVEDGYYVDHPEKSLSYIDFLLEKGYHLVVSPWFFLGISIGAYYLYTQYARDAIANWRARREEAKELESIKKNPDLMKSRLEAMENARRRLQEEHEQAAALHASKRAQKDEEKRKKKVEDWEILQKGGSTKNRKNQTDSKKQNYFPLMGSGDTQACYRPNRRSGSGGGG